MGVERRQLSTGITRSRRHGSQTVSSNTSDNIAVNGRTKSGKLAPSCVPPVASNNTDRATVSAIKIRQGRELCRRVLTLQV